MLESQAQRRYHLCHIYSEVNGNRSVINQLFILMPIFHVINTKPKDPHNLQLKLPEKHFAALYNTIPDRTAVHIQCRAIHGLLAVSSAWTTRTLHHTALPVQCTQALPTQNVLHVPFSVCSIVAVYTAQSMQPTCSHTLLVHCSYTACTLHFGLGTALSMPEILLLDL